MIDKQSQPALIFHCIPNCDVWTCPLDSQASFEIQKTLQVNSSHTWRGLVEAIDSKSVTSLHIEEAACLDDNVHWLVLWGCSCPLLD